MLGAASILLCFFIVYQLKKAPTLSGLGGSRLSDPLLERMHPLSHLVSTNIVQQPVNQKASYGEQMNTITPPVAPTRRGRTPR